jgi:hypothetical protein
MTSYHYAGLVSFNLWQTYFYTELLELCEDIKISAQDKSHKIIRWWLGVRYSEIDEIHTDRLEDFGIHIRQYWLCLALPTLIGKQSIHFSEVRQNIPPKLMNRYYWQYCQPFHKWFLIYEVSLDSTGLWQILS